jgi:hypothetical protein
MDRQIEDHIRKLVDIATRSGKREDLSDIAFTAFLRDIDPKSQAMADSIRSAFPAAEQHEIEAAVEYVAHFIGHMRRFQKPDGNCLWCQQPANRHHPLSPIAVSVCTPDEDEPPHEFCSTQCFAHWAAECGGGDYRTTTDMYQLMDTATRPGHHGGIPYLPRIRRMFALRAVRPRPTLPRRSAQGHDRRSQPPQVFCNWECLAHWAAKEGGGTFVLSKANRDLERQVQEEMDREEAKGHEGHQPCMTPMPTGICFMPRFGDVMPIRSFAPGS